MLTATKKTNTENIVVKGILNAFEGCSGLKINYDKTEIFPIRYPASLWPTLMDVFPGNYSSLPGKYLGLPLHYRNVKRTDLQPLIEKINNRLAGWKGKLLSKAGRETLVKSVLSAQPIYHLTVFPPHKWLLHSIDKMRRNFLWKGNNPEVCSGGHCLINWPTTCLPKSKGGLGILDLERFARGLRLRWLWLRWKSKDRAWTAMKLPCDSTDEDLFNASTMVTVGNEKIAEFWKSSWIHGQAPKSIAPSLFRKTKRKNITVEKALTNNNWIRLCFPCSGEVELREFVSLWQAIGNMQELNGLEDTITWKWSADGQYSASSAYNIQFSSNYSTMNLCPIWKAMVEPRCRFFAWTLLHKRILTADNLLKRGWPCNPLCCLCNSAPETILHLCKDCSFSREVWNKVLSWANLPFLNGILGDTSLYDWWTGLRSLCNRQSRRCFDGLLIHFWWILWLERNNRIFQSQHRSVNQVALAVIGYC
jgi:hypothetical protein